MSSGIEEIVYRWQRKPNEKLVGSLGKKNSQKKSFIPEEEQGWDNLLDPSLQMNEYGLKNFAMMIPERSAATYAAASSIKYSLAGLPQEQISI